MEPFSYCIIIGITGEASANGVTKQQQQIIEQGDLTKPSGTV